MMGAAVLRHHIRKGREGPLAHVVIPLVGRFKGGTGSRHHLQAVVNETASKLKVEWWLERLNGELIRQGQRNGPACCDEEGNLAQASQYQETFFSFFDGNSTGTSRYNFGGCECWGGLWHRKVV